MEMTACFLLLLLLCSPSTAQLQSQTDNDITALGEQTERQRRETTVASNQGNMDLQAYLRELSNSLAEQRVEIGRLQRENEAQEAKLESQRAEVEKLKQNLEAQAAELVTMKSRTNVTENQVEALRRDGEVKQVAFSASLLTSGTQTLRPSNTPYTLVFRHVVSNIGNAYNPDTGVFTAPVRGAYHFEVYIGAYGHATHAGAAALMKNAGQVLMAYEYQTNGYGNSANGATLFLEVGDVVFLRLPLNSRIYDNENHHCTFSGHLLFTM